MRILHTADWHVGKTLRGRSRAAEHRDVLDEIAGLAREREVDLVLIAGDLFDSAAPAPEAEKIVYDALIGLTSAGAEVVVVTGNHDSPQRLEAVRPLLELASVHTAHALSRPEEGGVRHIRTRRAGTATVALLPFLSQRAIVRADDLMSRSAADHAASYAERAARIVEALSVDLPVGSVNLFVAHAMVHGGVLGGGERSAHTVFEYSMPTTAFSSALHYVALGHLHRAQRIAGACPIWYCGSPLQLDFGETADPKGVNLIEAEPGVPARVETVSLTRGKRLRTLSGTLDEVLAAAGSADDDAHLRVEIDAPYEPGLADRVRAAIPTAVEVRLVHDRTRDERVRPVIAGRTPEELFAAYLAQSPTGDERVRALFAELLEEVDAPVAT